MDDTDDVSEVDQSELDDTIFPGDPLLEAVVALVHSNPEMQVPVTLNVSGGVVTGLLVGVNEWLQDAIDKYGTENGVTGIYMAWQRALADETPEVADLPPAYIHLKDAVHVTGGSLLPTGEGFFWRGALEDVSGWSLGSLGSN